MGTMASQVTSFTIVYSIVYSGPDQRKHQSSASLAFVRGIHRGPVNSPHKGPVTRKMFSFDDVIMIHMDCALLCYVVFWCWSILPMSFKVTSLALGWPSDCSCTSEATLVIIGKYVREIFYKLLQFSDRRKSRENYVQLSWKILYFECVSIN